MDSLQIGPFAIPVDRLPAIAALAALLLAAALVARGRPALQAWATESVLLALVTARVAFVAVNWPAYASHPLTALYIWQGGFLPLAGAAALLPYTFWRLRRDTDALLRAAIPLGAAGVVFLGAALAAAWLKPPEQPIPDLALETMAGQREPLRTHLGQPLIINLWATWCAPCRREMPMLVDLAASRENVTILLVNQGETRAQVRAYLDDVGLDGEAVRLDPDNRTSQALKVNAYPTTLVYDGSGNLVTRRAGEISRAAVRSAIAAARRAAE